MSITSVREQGVHMIFKDKKIVGFYTRDEESNENVIFVSSKASLDEIKELFIKDEPKIK